MLKREHETNDFIDDNDRPLKRQRIMEADIDTLSPEVIEKILLWIPNSLQGNRP